MKKLLLGAAPFALLSAQIITHDVVGPAGAQPRQMRIETRHVVGPMTGAVEFMSVEMGSSAPVKNAPYSAEAVTETVQTLADGNRITRKNSVMQYRDSEGRMRREFALQSMGRLGDVEAGASQTITIDDPVAKMHYSLDAKNKTAMKMARGEGMQNMMLRPPPPPPPPGGLVAPAAPATVIMSRTFERSIESGGVTFAASTSSSASVKAADAKEEDLGTRNIEGVTATGTRSTVTIPAGEVGNELALRVVVEKWYSGQLKTFVLTRHSDPRVGETTLRLTNVRLGEPPATLFEVPAGFTVQEPSMRVQQLIKRSDEKRQE